MLAWIGFLIGSSSALADGPTADSTAPVEVTFLGDRSVPAIRVRANGEPVAIPNCRGVAWERFDEASERYFPIPEEPCEIMEPPRPVDANGFDFEAPANSGLTAGDRVRVSVVVGIGCLEGEPLELAACTEIVEAPRTLGVVRE